MVEKVSKLFPRGSFRDPDGVLEYSKGELKSVLVLGEMRDGRLWSLADAELGGSLAEVLWLVERFKLDLISDAYEEG